MGEHGQVVVVGSQKGGVGKTTVALNLAHALATRGTPTVLVDADPLGSVASSIAGDLAERPGLREVLDGAASLDSALIQTRLEGLALLPRGRLTTFDAARWSAALEDGDALGGVFDRLSDGHGVVLVDTPPGLAGSTLGALRQGDWLLSPLQAEPLAARAVEQTLELIGDLRGAGATIRLLGFVLTMLQSREESSLGVAQESWRLLSEEVLLDTVVPRDNVFLNASAAGVPVALLSRRRPAVAAVFESLAGEIEERLDLGEPDDAEPIYLLD